jgi:ABC-type transport system involved in multi-copper enzyme maturation permease subunit
MIKLLRIELKKILTYRIFWILTGLYFFFLAAGILLAEFIFNNMINDFNKRMPIPFPHVRFYFFPDIWQNITYFASIRYVLIFPAIIIIILITNEFANKTIRQNVVNGMSRQEFLWSKMQVILLLSVVITLIVGIGILILGFLNSDIQSFSIIIRRSSFILGFFVSVFSVLILAFFFGFLMRNTGLSIALFVLYVLIIEPVVYFTLKIPPLQPNKVSTYLPFNSMIRITEYPSVPMLKQIMGFQLQSHVSLAACGISLLYSAVMIGIVFWVLYKKDL